MNKKCTKCSIVGSAPALFRADRNICRKCSSAERHPERASSKRHLEQIGFGRDGGLPPRLKLEVESIATSQRWPSVELFDKATEIESDFVVREPEIIVSEVEKLTPIEEHRLKTKNADLQRQVKLLIEQLDQAQSHADFRREAAEASALVEPIRIRERVSGLREGTVQVLVSDLHIEEEVRPEQVAGRNRYNLEISKKRCERLFQATRSGIDLYRNAYKIRDMILWLGGDLITGYLHPDNIESNLLAPVEAIAELQGRLTGGIDYLLEDPELERITIPCNDGNHGRLTEKMRSASRVQNSIEWLLYWQLSQVYKNEPRVEFILPQGAHTYFEVYGETIHYTHGDEAKYGGGVGGILIPIRKAVDRWNSVRPARLNCMGHFHQRVNVEDIIVNGSMIGYGPYSFTVGARFEPPVQDFSILDSKRWRGPSMPIWVSEREDDEGV